MLHRAFSRTLPALVALFAAASAQSQVVYNPDNGHYYERVGDGISWSAAESAAASRTHLGASGYLATITSQAETDFLLTAFGGGALSGLSIGGFQASGQSGLEVGWQWITGEAWSYVNWSGGEPNDGGDGVEGNDENNLQFSWYDSTGRWNDLPAGNSINYGYLVEYNPDVSVVPEPGAVTLLLAGGLTGGWLARRRFQKFRL